jgi:hypothetical protein
MSKHRTGQQLQRIQSNDISVIRIDYNKIIVEMN